MPKTTTKKRSTRGPHFNFRLDPELQKSLATRVEQSRFKTPSAYVRHLIQKDLGAMPAEDRVADLEKLMAANHNRVTGALRNLAVTQRAMYALLDSFAKATLSYLPDGGPASANLARARGKERYEAVLRVAEKASFELLDNLAEDFRRRTAEE